ncbi:MAG: methylmalonyl-CoA epimerase [gamma proteobacterium symbiont of Ctena orbiculata]|nr:MAG: methylmalonyl-CoA epimerase [gamma proteobacterium symbiont of Ctena orbiculata]
MNIDHICIAVRSIDRAIPRIADMFGYTQKTNKITNTRQKVNVVFLEKQESLDIKLIEPSSPDSPLVDSLKKGEGLHHICFKTDKSVSLELDLLKQKGLRVLADAEKGEAFDDELIAFIYAGFGLNIELIDTDKRRGLINTLNNDEYN